MQEEQEGAEPFVKTLDIDEELELKKKNEQKEKEQKEKEQKEKEEQAKEEQEKWSKRRKEDREKELQKRRGIPDDDEELSEDDVDP